MRNIEAWRLVVTALAVLLVLGQYGLSYMESRQKRAESATLEEKRIAQHVVAAMLLRFPVKDSHELEERTTRYLDALRRAKAEGRGVPVYRDDGSIGVEWSISIGDRIRLSESLDSPKPREK